MADELSGVDLGKLTIEDVKRLKNQAIERLKAAGQKSLEETQSHQNGSHSDHTNHSTGPAPMPP
jgi:hypothetical protein